VLVLAVSRATPVAKAEHACGDTEEMFMRLRGAIVLVGVLVVAACGGSDVSTSNEPATDTSGEGEVIRSAGWADETGAESPWAEEGETGEGFPMPPRPIRPPVRVINGCQIEAGTRCVGADLSGADLTNAFLQDADCSGADFSNTNLTNVDFGGSNLSGAKFTGANLTSTSFFEANLTGANLSGARFNCTWMPDDSVNWGAGDC